MRADDSKEVRTKAVEKITKRRESSENLETSLDNLKDKDIDSVLSYIKSFWPDDIYQQQINLNK